MTKIIIIGGGIAGLSAAHLLSNYKNFNIELFEQETEIGGQAASQKSSNCYTEYSWRIFGKCYHNLMYVINEINAMHNFVPLTNPCMIDVIKLSCKKSQQKRFTDAND